MYALILGFNCSIRLRQLSVSSTGDTALARSWSEAFLMDHPARPGSTAAGAFAASAAAATPAATILCEKAFA
ncbi:MAG TPA: hypothetical protein VEV85_08885 [Bryobacteraceae bacterium]|nr:hypothetical protein [Bryobacteraceae bacterium]